MVIIFQTGNEFWIETLLFTHTTVAVAATSTVELALQRTGFLLAISHTQSQPNNNLGRDYICINTTSGNGNFTIGQQLSAIRSRLTNLDGVDTNTVVDYVTVMLRGTK